MNMNKIQADHTPTDSFMIHAANERNTEHVVSVNTPMTYLPLSTIVAYPVNHQLLINILHAI